MKKIVLFCFMALCFTLPLAITSCTSDSETPANLPSININVKGIMISITADISLEDGYIVGEAHNALTFGFSKIYTIVILYSSDIFTENKDEMEYECYVESDDLNLGKSVIAKTLNEGKYYRCVVRFKDGSNEWLFVESDTVLFE